MWLWIATDISGVYSNKFSRPVSLPFMTCCAHRYTLHASHPVRTLHASHPRSGDCRLKQYLFSMHTQFVQVCIISRLNLTVIYIVLHWGSLTSDAYTIPWCGNSECIKECKHFYSCYICMYVLYKATVDTSVYSIATVVTIHLFVTSHTSLDSL